MLEEKLSEKQCVEHALRRICFQGSGRHLGRVGLTFRRQ